MAVPGNRMHSTVTLSIRVSNFITDRLTKLLEIFIIREDSILRIGSIYFVRVCLLCRATYNWFSWTFARFLCLVRKHPVCGLFVQLRSLGGFLALYEMEICFWCSDRACARIQDFIVGVSSGRGAKIFVCVDACAHFCRLNFEYQPPCACSLWRSRGCVLNECHRDPWASGGFDLANHRLPRRSRIPGTRSSSLSSNIAEFPTPSVALDLYQMCPSTVRTGYWCVIRTLSAEAS
jgi:hypothetical protein